MAVAWSWAFDTPFKWTKLIGKSLLSVGGAASRRSQHLEMKCDRVGRHRANGIADCPDLEH
jgi:hypothetical protein